jgi:gliding motility-associated-like protein
MIMKIKILFLFTILLAVIANVKAQPACGTNPAAGDYCSTATSICNLDGYCGNTSSTYTNTVSASNTEDENDAPLGTIFCGSIENNSWLSFVAGATTASFDIWPSNCSAGYGVQMEVFSTTDCYNFTSVSTCYNPASVTNGTVSATGLTVGQTYYIMIDGNSGDVCDYIIGAASGVATNPAITADQTICSGQTTTIDITNGGGGYSWTAAPADPSLSGQTTLASVSVHPAQTTTYTCNIASGNPNPNCPGSTTLTSMVTVLAANDPLCMANVTCNITATSDKNAVCPGENLNLSSSGGIGTVLLANTFNDGTVGVGWAATSTATYSNPCGVSPPYGTNYLWMGDLATAPRNLTSLDFDVHLGGTISFWMRYSIQADASPCEGPDEEDEGISLQYSTNSGTSWNDIVYFKPDGTTAASNAWLGQTNSVATGPTPYTNWVRMSYAIPAGGQTTSSRFRWIQLASTAAVNDHWGLDSIMIITPPPAQTTTWTSVPAGLNYVGTTPPTQNPLVNTCYIATISDGSTSCDDTVCVTMNSITANAGNDVSICGGSGTPLSASGGTIYSWDNAATLSATNISNPTASPTVTTTYTVTVSNANGCSDTDDVTVTVNNSLSSTMTFVNGTCGNSNGTATCTVSGGSPPYTYDWNTAPVQHTQTATSLPAGTYLVTASSGGCSTTNTVTVGNIPGPTAQINTHTDENCGHSNGSAFVTVTGGTGGLSYVWNTFPIQYTATASGLPSGNYTVTVTDGNSCSATASVTIINLPGPSASITTIINETCSSGNGGAIVTASNGTPPFTFHWNCVPPQYSDHMTNVHAGSYTITVTDANQCTATNNVTIFDSPPPTANIINVVPEDCGFSNGAATANPNGGLTPYTYVWNSVPQQFGITATNLPGGNYIVTVTDANTCTVTASVNIAIINGPVASVSGTPEYCDRSDGTVSATATGGSGTYSFTWSTDPPQNVQNLSNLPAGMYTVTVDDGGCSASATVSIINIPGPEAGFSVHPTVQTIMDGPVSFQDHSTGSNIQSWFWTLGDGSTAAITEFDHAYDVIGQYVITLVVEDENGCKDTAIDTLKVKDIYTIYIPNVFTPNGDGINDFFFPQGVSIDPNNYDMSIFDRWGNLMYHTNELTGQWNGTKNNSGKISIMDVYVYRIKVKEIEGTKHEYVGRVSLIP